MDEKTENPLNEFRAARGWDAETANLDTLIDNALATYTAGESSLDLSARILSAAHALERRKRPGLWLGSTRPWAFAAAGWLAAAVMLLVFINAHNLQIVVQPRPAAAQLAQSAPRALSPVRSPASASFKPAPRRPHFQQAVRAAVTGQQAQPSDRDPILRPIAFAPIVIAPIGSEEGN
jgi:hypothetical protein